MTMNGGCWAGNLKSKSASQEHNMWADFKKNAPVGLEL